MGQIKTSDYFRFRRGTQRDTMSKGVSSWNVITITADQITTGTLAAGTEVSVGDNSIIISGTNKTIVINDGTNDRVIIGQLS